MFRPAKSWGDANPEVSYAIRELEGRAAELYNDVVTRPNTVNEAGAPQKHSLSFVGVKAQEVRARPAFNSLDVLHTRNGSLKVAGGKVQVNLEVIRV